MENNQEQTNQQPIIIPTGNSEPNPKQGEQNDDMEGMPLWAKEMKQSMDKLTESLTGKPQPSPSPTPSPAQPIPQPPPAPKQQPATEPKTKESVFEKVARFLL